MAEMPKREQKGTTEKHRRKMVAPILVTILMILYFILYFGVLISLLNSTVLKLLLGICPVLLGAAMIGVCAERLREIKGGEEDDLGQY